MYFIFTSDDLLAKMEELNHFQRLKYQFSPKLCLYLSVFLRLSNFPTYGIGQNIHLGFW